MVCPTKVNSTPLTNCTDSSLEYRRASSNASSITTAAGVSECGADALDGGVGLVGRAILPAAGFQPALAA
jgi:hypothetical protein